MASYLSETTLKQRKAKNAIDLIGHGMSYAKKLLITLFMCLSFTFSPKFKLWSQLVWISTYGMLGLGLIAISPSLKFELLEMALNVNHVFKAAKNFSTAVGLLLGLCLGLSFGIFVQQ